MNREFLRDLRLSGGIILLSFVIFGSAFSWFAADIKKKAEAIALNRTLITQRASSIGALASLKQNAAEAEVYQRYMDQLLPPQENLLGFRPAIEAVGRTNDVAVSIGFQNAPIPSDGTQPGFLSFSMDVRGSYEGLGNFFDQIEKRSREFLVAIDSVDLAQEGEGYRAVAQGKVFFK